jgi:hypothetical protein
MSEQTPFEQACAERGWHTPAAFLHAFHATGQLIGEPVTLTDRQLRRWRQPHPPAPRPRAWRVLNAMFGISPTVLGFHMPPGGETIPADLMHGGKEVLTPVDRRSFATGTLGAAAGLTLSAVGAVGTAHLLELREGLRSLYTLDDAYGGGDVRSLAVRHLRRIRRVINTSTYPDSIGRQLQLLAGETAEMCGWLSFDAGHQDDARRYWGEALTCATVLHDHGLQVLVMASLAEQELYENRPRDGLNLARASRERAEAMGSPTLVSVLAAREARALALMDDRSAAQRQMSLAMRTFEQSGRGKPPPAWTAFHGPAELDFAQGLVYAGLGHHNSATPFLRAALAHQERTYGRNRALYRATLALSLVKDGLADESAAEAVGTLSYLDEVDSGRVMGHLTQVTDMLYTSGSTAAREAAERLSEHAHRKTEAS